MKPSPNIVLICVDQWRGDCLGVEGHPVVQTPYLNELAIRGVRFTRAYSSSPTCIAARTGLMTGQGQATHGRVGYQDGVPWNYANTLAGELTAAGYQTQAVGKMHVFPERSQIGFQNVILHDGYLHHARHTPNHADIDDYLPWLQEQLGRQADYLDHGVDCNSQVARPWDKPEYTHPTNWVTSQSIDFLHRRDPRKPFFLYLSYHRPHPPYDPPAWALEQYLNMPLPDPPVGDWEDFLAPWSNPDLPMLTVGPMKEQAYRRAQAGYYGHMTHIDHQTKRLHEVLFERGLYDNTWFCFISDHGELMGDHHLFRKSLPYEGSARIPMILTPPANCDLPRNIACDAVVELRDVMPTLLEIAGVAIPDSVEGKSLLPVARGEIQQVRDCLHGEHLSFGQSVQWITDERWKYVWFSQTGYEQLFDLQNDPQELRNLSNQSDCSDDLAFCRSRLIEHLTGREEGYVQNGQLIPEQQTKPTLNHIMDDHLN